ncbi:hypothetical protein Pyn_38300 [Prunus yedoensis var. nudiflora]|uniref:Uncharacterized protein n=1 Tax=Prunus yedoensis var. nudiflora TaxID=2094558 RepID=A0A314ZKF8_PRUYE|nr:hypothetical protein Pyn_38300 [Prunus yedoensis var. nudiflora]
MRERKIRCHMITEGQVNAGGNIVFLPLDGLEGSAAYATQLHCIIAFEEFYRLKATKINPGNFSRIFS